MLGLKASEAGTVKPARFSSFTSAKWLSFSGKLWFIIAAIGQAIFTLYILGLYGIATATGNWDAWNTAMPHGIVSGDAPGNVSVVMHVLLAAVVSIGGPLQIIPQVRNRFPKFHRINGRIYIMSGVTIALTGLFILWTRGSVGSVLNAIATSLNGLLIIAFSVSTIKYAWTRKMAIHRRWSLRLFMVMSGVWFFRVGLMFWLLIWQRPVGFDAETFTGPFLVVLSFNQYLLPLLLLEIYFAVKKSKHAGGHWAYGVILMFFTLATLLGLFGATVSLWMPRVL
ncbi:MAG: DUF2306 domain-containing protein [Bacteroidota bacterium]